MPPRVDLVALSLLPVWRWRSIAEQLRNGQAPSDILHAHCADAPRGRNGLPFWSNPVRVLERAAGALVRAAAAGLHGIGQDDVVFPARLREIVDPPPVLWVSGQPAALLTPAVAVVGSRAGSAYALSVAERLGADLASRGVCVLSGLARGVDAAAHRGALSVGGQTVAVLGCGADIVYPPEHAGLAASLQQRGAVVSELAPGTVPKPGFFPRRNRIISGLAQAVVVVEAGEKSGSLITARCALEQGRDVLAVPGNVLNGRNRGGHALLRDGARLVETAEDVFDELGWRRELAGQSPETGPGEGDPVLDAMVPGESLDLGQISAGSGLTAAELLPRLLALELRGVVGREPGGRFVRFGRTC